MKNVLIFLLGFHSVALFAQKELKTETSFRFKGQNKSLFPWDKLDPVQFLDFNLWENELRKKEKTKDWSSYVHDKAQNEKVGIIMKCIGSCRLYRGIEYVEGQYRSSILEGDIVHTQKDSLAWVLLIDGSLVRISSHTSVSFNEVNFSKERLFFYVRLNEGHIYWKSYDNKPLKYSKLAETDPVFLPLMIPEANVQKYEREYYQKYKEDRELILKARLDKEFYNKLIYNAANTMLKEESKEKIVRKETKVLFVSPVATLEMNNPSFHFLYVLGGEGHFYPEGDVKETHLQLREDTAKTKNKLEANNWYGISSFGREYKKIEQDNRILNMFNLSVKRIPSIILSREILFKGFFHFFEELSQEKLAQDYGYRYWDDEDITKHVSFLKHYAQEAEVGNLRSLRKLLAGNPVTLDGVPTKSLQDVYNNFAIRRYYQSLSMSREVSHPYVKHYSSTEYYLWLLHYARKDDKVSPVSRQ